MKGCVYVLGWRDTPPSLFEIKGAQAARVDGDVGPPLQTGALLAPLQPSPMTSTERDSQLFKAAEPKSGTECRWEEGTVSSAPPSDARPHHSSRCLT